MADRASVAMRAGRTSRRWRPGRLLALLPAAALLAGACGGSDDGAAAGDASTEQSTTTDGHGTTTTVPSYVTWVAEASRSQVTVFAEPGGREPVHVLENPSETGAPLVFLLDGQDAGGDWLPVHLPVRPNGSTGYVRAADVTLAQNDYGVRVELAAHQLTVTRRGETILEAPIGVGRAETPTPGGVYYVKELLQPPDPDGPYGAYAYGLSGFSNALDSFNGGDGVIGIHGTDDPQSVGQDVSHGCIRVTNDVITEIAGYLPLGTPVEIVA